MFKRIDLGEYPEENELKTAFGELVQRVAIYRKCNLSTSDIEKMVDILIEKLDKFIPGRGLSINFFTTIAGCLISQYRRKKYHELKALYKFLK